MTTADNVREWLKFAEADLFAANDLYSLNRQAYYHIICNHCRQSAEKSLKALLILSNMGIFKTHDLIYLYKLLSDKYELREILEPCARLNRYDVSPKYPFGIKTEESDADAALKDARFIFDYVNKIIISHTDDGNTNHEVHPQ